MHFPRISHRLAVPSGEPWHGWAGLSRVESLRRLQLQTWSVQSCSLGCVSASTAGLTSTADRSAQHHRLVTRGTL